MDVRVIALNDVFHVAVTGSPSWVAGLNLSP